MTTQSGVSPPAASSRPHRSARIEDAVDRWIASRLRRRGWTVRVEPFTSYGGDGWVRVLARAVLAAPVVDAEDLPGAGAATHVERPRADDQTSTLRGWRSFLTAQVAGARLEISVDGAVHQLVADRGGYVDEVVPAQLEPGWHELTVRTEDGRAGLLPVLVVDPSQRLGVVSDIDDTVMVTRLPRPLVAAWNYFVRHESAREAVPGMARLYHDLLAAHAGTPVFYLSTGAWNAAPAIGRFLRRHRFPVGPMLLTDFGPTNTGWFRSGQEHKRTTLRRLLREFPDLRWVLIGDDGQHDPAIYAELVREDPDRVEAVLIRQLTGTEHVLAHGVPAPAAGQAEAESRTRRTGTPVVQGADGKEIAAQLRASGALIGGDGHP